jgi:hypothetical protein
MTLQEFDNTRWSKGMFVNYRDARYLIAQVDFEERLLGLIDPELVDEKGEIPTSEISWARCENATLMNKEQGDKSSATQ